MKINKKGFTLIELLVVISIIGILAGILVLIIDPTTQQNKARNATIRSTILKIAYGINSARAASGLIPSNTQLPSELSSISGGTSFGTALNYSFVVDGINLPLSCATSASAATNVANTGGVGTVQCKIGAYSTLLAGTQFRVFAEGHSPAGTEIVYVYDSISGLYECTSAAAINGATVAVSGCTKLE